jgi:hypothetical protein
MAVQEEAVGSLIMTRVNFLLRIDPKEVVLLSADALTAAAGGIGQVEVLHWPVHSIDLKDFAEITGHILSGRILSRPEGQEPVGKVTRRVGWAEENVERL